MNQCKVDCKQLVKLSFIALVVVMATDYIIHGKLLVNMYMQTASLWRTEEEIQSLMGFMLVGHAMSALFFAWIFLHGYKGTGVMEGVRYGLLFGGYIAGFNLIMHTMVPYPTALTVSWIVYSWIQLVLTGAIMAKFAK